MRDSCCLRERLNPELKRPKHRQHTSDEEDGVRTGTAWVSPLMLSFQMPRTEWVLNWPGQVTIAGCQTYWTMEVAQALEAGNISDKLFPQLSKQVELKRIGAPHTPAPHTQLF